MNRSDDGVSDSTSLRLLSSNRVEGVPVFGRDGETLGTVAAIIFDRFTGQAEYIVVLMGRMLGLGGSYHPLPWKLASYQAEKGGYVLIVEKTTLASGPSFKSATETTFDQTYTARITSYYRL